MGSRPGPRQAELQGLVEKSIIIPREEQNHEGFKPGGAVVSFMCRLFFFLNSHPHTPSLFPVRPRTNGPCLRSGMLRAKYTAQTLGLEAQGHCVDAPAASRNNSTKEHVEREEAEDTHGRARSQPGHGE